MYTIPPTLHQSLNTWIAVPKSNVSLFKTLFSGTLHDDEDLQKMRSVAEEKISGVCEVLTLGQGCADWFVLRQFRVTGTNAGVLLMSCEAVKDSLGLQESDGGSTNTQEEWFGLLHRGWFSSKVSTEAMKRGTINEPAVISALEGMEFVKAVFDVGMLAMKNARYLACSPDGFAVLDIQSLEEWSNVAGLAEFEDRRFVLASVEIKTRVASSTLGEAAELSSADVLTCGIGDDVFRKYVPREHMGQIMQQASVLKVDFCMYVAAGETGLLYKLLIRIPGTTRELLERSLVDCAMPLVKWAFEDEAPFPAFVNLENREQLQTRHKFWQIIDRHVRVNGCFVPLKLFKHAAQSFYSKTKAGVDGATQQRAILRSSTSHFKWEQKIVSQIIKTLAVNAFLAWRMFQRQDLLESEESFKSIDNYRNSLNKVQATADFMLDAAQEHLSHAADIQIRERSEERTDGIVVTSTEEAKRLVKLAHEKKRNRLNWFNSTDGVALRLWVRGHHTVQGPLTHCALCGQHSHGYRGHRTTFKCNLCSVHLCLKVPPGYRKSCSHLWHSSKYLEQRKIPARAPSRVNDASSTGERGSVHRESNTTQRGARNSQSNVEQDEEQGDEIESVQQPEAENRRLRSSAASTGSSRRRSKGTEGVRSLDRKEHAEQIGRVVAVDEGLSNVLVVKRPQLGALFRT